MAMTKEQRLKKYPSLEFECSWCGDLVITDSSERIDKRSRFCCARCERQYWRKVTRHPTHLTNLYAYQVFRDVNKYDK
jgi:hypothetical protein